MVRFATELFVNMLSNSLAAIIRRGADEISLSTMAPNRAADEIYYPKRPRGGQKTVETLESPLKRNPGTLKTTKTSKIELNDDQEVSKMRFWECFLDFF